MLLTCMLASVRDMQTSLAHDMTCNAHWQQMWCMVLRGKKMKLEIPCRATYASERRPRHAAPICAAGARHVIDHFKELLEPQRHAPPLAVSWTVPYMVVHASKPRRRVCDTPQCQPCGIILTCSLCEINMT